MAAFYSELDPFAAAWLRELIGEGLIPDGVVDERDIRTVAADDLRGYRSVHLFAGVGGWPLALRLAGWPDDRPVWTGSCPCQPYSSAGKGLGDADPRNLWPDMYRLVRECRPVVTFGEQVEGAVRKGWLDGVSADLESEGYAVGSCVLGAHSVGAPHIRQRLYWVADAGCFQHPRGDAGRGIADGAGETVEGRHRGSQDADDQRRGTTGIVAHPRRERVRAVGHGPYGSPTGGVQGTDGERQRVRADAGDGGASDGLGHADCRGCGERLQLDGGAAQPGKQSSQRDDAGGSGAELGAAGVPQGDTGGPGLEGRGLSGRGRVGERLAPASGSDVGWDAFDLIPCRDGKASRVEPGSFPLAHGIPRKLGPLLAVLLGMGVDPVRAKRLVRNARSRLAKAGRNRVGRLRGYGNAICPQDGALFVSAYLDVTGA